MQEIKKTITYFTDFGCEYKAWLYKRVMRTKLLFHRPHPFFPRCLHILEKKLIFASAEITFTRDTIIYEVLFNQFSKENNLKL